MNAEALYRRSPGWLQNLLFNAYALGIEAHRYGPRYRDAARQALERDRWPLDRLRSFQLGKLRAVLDAAYGRTVLYREVMDSAGVKPGDIGSVEDLALFPILDRDVVRNRGGDMMTSAPQLGWRHGHTSGTTGSPLGVWYDRTTCLQTNAVDRRQKAWAGMGEGDWLGLLLGRVVVPPEQDAPPFWRVNLVQRQVWFSTFHLSPQNLEAYVDEIERRELRFLEGYPSTLFIVARHLVARRRTLPMDAIFTSSETLHRIQIEAMEQAFGCRPFDFYGHAERAIFATECERHSGKHVSEDFGIVEVTDARGDAVADGELGFLTGTSLHNLAMPIIRYRTSDVSRIIPEPCPCGRTHRRIDSVTTKAEDIVVTPDGRMISPSVLTHPFKPFDTITKSQIIQERPDLVRVLLVASDDFSPRDKDVLVSRLSERLGEGVTVRVEEVEELPPDRSGKFRWVISRVDHTTRVDWGDTHGGHGESGQ